ncbi:PhzF family phenazine biosynthesis protein [Parasutterella excrementihominis]|uniref:PhzF family phenazine biosynthesis protein n=1 Tax=Parasutterella excrementihominis TaxID=487175 RepID=UPI002432E67B|nr:PhzF family phenazine biosynthesis protein [Parasutterella excrementihominis]
MIKQFIADAFTDKIFHGNPAAICLPERWPDDKLMQDIASENNLSETAFVVKEDSGWKLRWFTPGGEIDLCGHATLATAFVLMNFVEPDLTEVQFSTLSGKLSVKKKNDLYEMDFPAYELKRIEVTEAMKKAIGCKPLEAWIGRDLVCVLENEDQVIQAKPDLEKAKALDGLLLHITAKGKDKYDCVSRTFAPKLAVDEDPVCGSGHCHLVPLWSEKLGKKEILAYQTSSQGGVLYCELDGKRVKLAGKAALYSRGELCIEVYRASMQTGVCRLYTI